MRFNDFKLVESKKLYETANAGLETQHTLHDINAIKTAIPNIPNEKAEEKVELLGQIKKLNNAIKSFVDRISPKKVDQSQTQQQAPEPQVEPARQTNDPNATVEEDKANPNVQKKLYSIKDIERTDAEIEEELNDLLDNIKFLETVETANPNAEAKKQEALKRFNKNLDSITKKFETVRAQRDSARAERDEAINFVKEVTGVLVTLGNKVQGFQEDTDTGSMTAKDRASFKKMAVNAEKFTKTLKQALFGKILDMQEGSDVTGQEIKEFLEACVRGDVINMLQVIGTSRGNIKDYVNPKYQKVFDVFVEENIFSYSPGTTSGAIGPGEMALSMMGNPAEKGKKGDLKIGDEEVEIKASAKTGGRFNSKAIAKATTGWQTWAKKINEIMSQAPEDATISVTQKNGEEKLIPAREYNGNRYNVIKGKAKEGSKYNWNASGFKALNIEVLQPYSNLRQTFDLFESSIRALVQNYDKLDKPQQGNSHHKPFNPGDLIEAAINDDGTVDMKKMNIAYSKIAYASYHLADGITTVMLLRTDNLDYTIFRDADELVDQMNSDSVITGGGFNWNDDQQTPTPGYIAS